MSPAAPTQVCWLSAVLQDEEGNVLVSRRRDSQAWDLPGGALRVGEDIHTGVRRVVAETATIGVSVGWITGIHSHIRDGVTMVFLAKHVTGRVTPQGDTQVCRWVPAPVAVRMLWPRRADQLLGAVSGQTPQPVVVVQPRAPLSLRAFGIHRFQSSPARRCRNSRWLWTGLALKSGRSRPS